MKIGFITTYFYPVLGGAETNCFHLARELAKKNEVHIFTSNNNTSPKEETLDKIHIHRSKTLFRSGYYAAFYPSLLKNLLHYDLDIVHVHSYGFLWHDLCVLLKKFTSPHTKFVITPHGPFMTLPSYPLWKKIFKLFVYTLEYFPNTLYDLVFQVNPTQINWLPHYGFKKKNIRFLPNGIPSSFLKKDKTLPEFHDKFLITYIGRVQRYKGLAQVIQILPELISFNKKILFVIAGDPQDMQALVKQARQLKVGQHLLFLGKITEEEKKSLLQTTSVFVFPSKWEAFGISMLEAMAKGCAVISTNTEGGKFLIEEAKNGYLFTFGDITTLKEKLLLLTHKKLLSSLSKNNKKKAALFTWEKITQDLQHYYEMIS